MPIWLPVKDGPEPVVDPKKLPMVSLEVFVKNSKATWDGVPLILAWTSVTVPVAVAVNLKPCCLSKPGNLNIWSETGLKELPGMRLSKSVIDHPVEETVAPIAITSSFFMVEVPERADAFLNQGSLPFALVGLVWLFCQIMGPRSFMPLPFQCGGLLVQIVRKYSTTPNPSILEMVDRY